MTMSEDSFTSAGVHYCFSCTIPAAAKYWFECGNSACPGPGGHCTVEVRVLEFHVRFDSSTQHTRSTFSRSSGTSWLRQLPDEVHGRLVDFPARGVPLPEAAIAAVWHTFCPTSWCCSLSARVMVMVLLARANLYIHSNGNLIRANRCFKTLRDL